jgi:hypothetical protein
MPADAEPEHIHEVFVMAVRSASSCIGRGVPTIDASILLAPVRSGVITPLSLIGFKIDRTEETKEPKESKELKPDSKSGKGGPQPQPTAPVLSALGFDLKFTASPDSLRDFLNALTRDKQAFFVVRRFKVTTLSKDGVPMLAPSKAAIATPVEPAAPGQPQAAPVAQYILGDEHVEVEMRVDLLTALPPPPPPPTPGEKSAKPPTKEGTKQP